MTIQINFEDINSEYLRKEIKFNAQIIEAQKPQLEMKIAIYECKSCMRLHEVPQLNHGVHKVAVCNECGGRAFKLLESESVFQEIQFLKVGTNKTSRTLLLLLNNDYVSYDLYHRGDSITVVGVLEIFSINNKPVMILVVNDIQHLENNNLSEKQDTENRNYPEYNIWRKHIITRDNICQICGGGKHLEAHHIYSYKENPDLRLDEGNGITLCKFCHNKFHSYYGKNVTPIDLIKFIHEFRGL